MPHPPSAAYVPVRGDRIEFDAVQQPSSPLPIPSDQHVVLTTRSEPSVLTHVPHPSAGRATAGRRGWLRTRAVQGVEVVEVAGRLGDVVEDLDLAIQLALAEGSRGVVCDLSTVFEGAGAASAGGAGPVAVEVLASAGRHGRDWPAIPVAVACPDPGVREALRAHPLGGHLIVTESLFSAVSAVLATPAVVVETLSLAPHPTAPRAAREFVTRTLLDWRLGRAIPYATLVVSELVASSSVNAGTEMDLSVAWNLGVLRLTVRDHRATLPGQPDAAPDLRRRGRTVVTALSRTFGVLPTADGGKVVWAVLEAPRPHRSAIPERPERTIATQSPPGFTDSRAMAQMSLSRGRSRGLPEPKESSG